MTTDAQQYLTTRQAAAYVGTTPAGWHRHAVRHGIPSVRYGRSPKSRRLYKRDDIDRWLVSCQQARDAGVRA